MQTHMQCKVALQGANLVLAKLTIQATHMLSIMQKQLRSQSDLLRQALTQLGQPLLCCCVTSIVLC